MHLRPRRKLAAQLKTVCRPVTMLVFYHTLVTKPPNYLFHYSFSCFSYPWLRGQRESVHRQNIS